jgi:hypothetical protein
MKNKGKVCKEYGCSKPARVRLYCTVHYNKKYQQQYWTKYYNDPKVKERVKEFIKKYRKKTGWKSNPFMHKKRFGGLREQVIQRDKERCVECGMTREEHKSKWGRDITVDHYDGNGRYSNDPNNDINNLQTMCLKCHGKKDVKRRFWRSVKAG